MSSFNHQKYLIILCFLQKKKKSKAAANLKAELLSQKEVQNAILMAFEQTKDSWFSHFTQSSSYQEIQEAIEAFFQYCILPRCMSSDPDALFCAKFIELVHNLASPFFSTVFFLESVIVLFSFC
jgi:THO complex subunit 2